MANNHLITSYQQLISSYQAIDNFRAQLLTRLPLATGGGIFLLYYATNGGISDETKAFLPAIGLFGFVVTLGLFVYEIYGIMKCTALINTGKQMEGMLGIDGQFLHRPPSFLNEPFAAGLIYPAVLAAWAYLAFAFVNTGSPAGWITLLGPAGWIALLVFAVFFAGTMGYNLKLHLNGKRTDLALLNQDILRAEEDGKGDDVAQLLHPGFIIVRSNGEKQDKGQFLNSMPTNKNRGRTAAYANIQMVARYAIYTSIVTTTQNPDGTPNPGRFWNTRVFVKENGHWRCLYWQVMKLGDV